MQNIAKIKQNFKKTFLVIFVCMLLTILLSGCVVSRTAENLWAVGTTEYYADFSKIENHTIYELNGEYYIELKLAAYASEPKLIGIIAPLNHFVEYKNPVDSERTSIWGKISAEAKTYLCIVEEVHSNQDFSESNNFSFAVEPMIEMTQQPVNSTPHVIVRTLPPIEVVRFCCGDIIHNSQHISTEKSFGSFALLPLMPIALAWDISATVIMSTYLDFVLIPNMLIAKAGKSFLGVED